MLSGTMKLPLLLFSLALVCLVAGPAVAEHGQSTAFDDTPWVEDPPGPGEGEGEGNGEGKGNPDGGEGPGPGGILVGCSDSGGDRPDPGWSLVDWMWLVLHTASY